MTNEKNTSLIYTLILFVVWTTVTLYGAILLTGGEEVSLDALVGNQFATQLFLAALLVLGYSFLRKIVREVGFKKGSGIKGWIFFYPIAVIVFGFIVLIWNGHIQIGSFVFWVLLNTFFVGISEELMFRGIILSSLVQRFSFWRSAIFMSLLFGLVHVLNGFITGEFSMALIQAGMATFSGFLFLAIRVRSNSIITAIIVHWLWDALVFMTSDFLDSVGENPDFWTVTFGIILIGSPVIFGITGIVQCLNKKVVASFMEEQLQTRTS